MWCEMENRTKWFYKGDKIKDIKLMEKLKRPIINLFLNTYPLFYSYGIIEHYFEDEFKEKVVTQLYLDGFIETSGANPIRYRLTSKGMGLAISLINLEHNKSISRYNRTMKRLTNWIIVLSILTFISGIVNILVN